MPLEPAWKPNILKLRCSKIIKDQAASNSPPLASASLALSAAIQLSSLWHPWPKPAIWLPLRLYSVFLSGTSTALVMGSAGKCLQYEMASTTNCTTCSRPPVCHSSIQEMSPTEFVWKKYSSQKLKFITKEIAGMPPFSDTPQWSNGWSYDMVHWWWFQWQFTTAGPSSPHLPGALLRSHQPTAWTKKGAIDVTAGGDRWGCCIEQLFIYTCCAHTYTYIYIMYI